MDVNEALTNQPRRVTDRLSEQDEYNLHQEQTVYRRLTINIH